MIPRDTEVGHLSGVTDSWRKFTPQQLVKLAFSRTLLKVALASHTSTLKRQRTFQEPQGSIRTSLATVELT